MNAKFIGIAILAIVLLFFVGGKRINNTLVPDIFRGKSSVPSVPSIPQEKSEAVCPKYSYTTDQIELIDERKVLGYKVEFYRNKAYTCARKGYHTFVIAYPENFSQSSQHPLWIRMHGGGVGAYAPEGKYVPSKYCSSPNAPCWIDEEPIGLLGDFLKETGLVSNIRQDNNFRLMAPSMCDHDLYAGLGKVEDKNNPNIDANGQKPRADGMLALRSAIEFTLNKYPTTHVFAHGTSAGSVGAANLATTLSCEGKNLSGAILDSGVISDLTEPLVAKGCGEYSSQDALYIKEKIFGSQNADPSGLFVDKVVSSGAIKTPLFDFWSSGDRVYRCPGKDFVTITDVNGNTYSGNGDKLVHKKLDEAIETYGKAIGSTYREVCADPGRNNNTCSMHIPTTRSKQITGGDLSRSGEDYNQVIMSWIKERLRDPLPNL